MLDLCVSFESLGKIQKGYTYIDFSNRTIYNQGGITIMQQATRGLYGIKFEQIASCLDGLINDVKRLEAKEGDFLAIYQLYKAIVSGRKGMQNLYHFYAEMDDKIYTEEEDKKKKNRFAAIQKSYLEAQEAMKVLFAQSNKDLFARVMCAGKVAVCSSLIPPPLMDDPCFSENNWKYATAKGEKGHGLYYFQESPNGDVEYHENRCYLHTSKLLGARMTLTVAVKRGSKEQYYCVNGHYQTECETLNQVGEIPSPRGIVELLRKGVQVNDQWTILLHFYRHGNLYSLLCQKKLKELDSISIALDIAYGLRYLHEKGFVHGDLNPKNILIDKKSDGTGLLYAGIGNFCFAFQGPPKVCKKITDWSSPEQKRKERCGFASDIWQFGAILQQMIKHPITLQMMENNPEKRPKVDEVFRLLRTLARQHGIY